MTELIIKYYFQNKIDKSENYLILNNDKYGLLDLKDLKSFMLQKKLIDANCYLRFKDYIGDCYTWIDIKNDKSPFPINSNNEVIVKILHTPYKVINYNFKEAKKETNKQKSNDPFSEQDFSNEDHKFNKSKSVNQKLHENYQKIEPKVSKKQSDSFDFLDNDHHPKQNSHQNNQNKGAHHDSDFLNVKLSDSILTKNTNRFLNEKDHQNEKMAQAQLIEPKIREWAYQNNVRKDVRTLLSTLDKLLWSGFTKWKKITIIDIIDDASLNSKIKQAKIIFHPDKNRNLLPGQLYLLERIFSEVNDSFKEYKSKK